MAEIDTTVSDREILSDFDVLNAPGYPGMQERGGTWSVVDGTETGAELGGRFRTFEEALQLKRALEAARHQRSLSIAYHSTPAELASYRTRLRAYRAKIGRPDLNTLESTDPAHRNRRFEVLHPRDPRVSKSLGPEGASVWCQIGKGFYDDSIFIVVESGAKRAELLELASQWSLSVDDVARIARDVWGFEGLADLVFS